MQSFHSATSGHRVFLYDDLVPVLVPTLFARSLIKNKLLYVSETSTEENVSFLSTKLKCKSIEEDTIKRILNRLDIFLRWVDNDDNHYKFLSLSTHHACPSDVLNEYINDVVIEVGNASESTAKETLAALNSYYNFLAHVGFCELKDLFIYSRHRSLIRENTKSRTSVKYYTQELRDELYKNTLNLRDELLLRTGGQLGLRSKENQGLVLKDFKTAKTKHQGLLSLFLLSEVEIHKEEFEFYLQGKFVKAMRYSGGVGRYLYIPRQLLMLLKKYYEYERPRSDNDHLFLTNSVAHECKLVSKSFASQVFTKSRESVLKRQEQKLLDDEMQKLEEDHTHHILRHSFGTDLFYELSKGSYAEVATTSAVYLEVAARMGHSAASQKAPETTKRYIRSCQYRDRLTGES